MKKVLLIIIRIIGAIASVVFSFFFIGSILTKIINPGSIAGLALCIWILCISVAPLHRKIRDIFSKHKFTKFIYRAVNVCFIVFSIYGAIVTSLMIYCACKSPAENATAVVLGAQVKPWGPSAVLSGRISGAKRYLENNPESVAVLSGGQGEDEHISEAQCMYETLTDKGIESDRLYPEDNSTNTTENIKYSMQVIEENNLNSEIAIATDSYHQLRAQIIARQQGVEGDVGAINSDTSFVYIPTFAVREWFALPYQVLFR